ncbi:MAG: hypothetical protein JNL17_07215 [Cyclobacteriaceae bacterium]|nr:hypothetical protein [Cyclobacteriaceae bacterium]
MRLVMTVMALLSTQILFGQGNTIHGLGAGNAGIANTSVGEYAGDVVTGAYNAFFGHNAGMANTSGNYNVFLGAVAGRQSTTGSNNTFVGSFAGRFHTNGFNNSGFGSQAGYSVTSGAYNAFIGTNAGYNLITGSNNVFVGGEAGYNSTGSSNVFLGFRAGYNETGSNKLYIDNSNTTTPLIFGDFATDKLVINGNVGIGSQNPSEKLTVNGTIYSKEVKVDLNVPGPDYVFSKDYALMTLDQVRSYIAANGHLPEVPSAQEMETNGINLSEMNMLLLKKIEELTLHAIQLNERVKELEKQGAKR